HPGRLLHNHGAIRCLERLLALLRPDGLILANDYGTVQPGSAEDYEHQRFSHATFTGVNFPLLQAYFSKLCVFQEPDGEGESIHTRRLAPSPDGPTRRRSAGCFGKDAPARLHEPVRHAREWARVGRFEAAATHYGRALERQPYNWVLLNEISMFLT